MSSILTNHYNLVDAGRAIARLARENASKRLDCVTDEQIRVEHELKLKQAMEEAKKIDYAELENEEQEDEMESVSNYPFGQEDIDEE